MPDCRFGFLVPAGVGEGPGIVDVDRQRTVDQQPAAYEALALRRATTPQHLAEVKARLAGNRDGAPLFDTGLFTRHLETAYATM